MTPSTAAVAWRQSAVVRPAVRVAQSERLYQGVFGIGLATATALAVLSALIALLQPAEDAVRSCAATLVAVLYVALLYRVRHVLYWRVRRRPAITLAAAAPLALLAAAAGLHNEQMFYVVSATISVIAVAAPLSLATSAAVVGGVGIAVPYLAAGGGPYGIVVAATILPLLFWLVVSRLAEFLLLEGVAPVPRPPMAAPAERSDVVDVAPTGPRPQPPAAPRHRPTAPHRPSPLRSDVRLTPRQTQVVLLIIEGLKHAEIAEELGITTKRVRDLLSGARARTNAATTAQLVAWHLASQSREDRPRPQATTP